MDVRIGVIHSPRELDIELADDTDRDALMRDIEDAMSDGAGVIWFTDRKGKRIGVPAGKVAYIEVGGAHDERRVGFGAS